MRNVRAQDRRAIIVATVDQMRQQSRTPETVGELLDELRLQGPAGVEAASFLETGVGLFESRGDSAKTLLEFLDRSQTSRRPELTQNHEIVRSSARAAERSRALQDALNREDVWIHDLLPPSDGQDDYLSALMEELGLSGLPHVVSSDELDRFVTNGERELVRGVSTEAAADAFRDGPCWVGTGSSGNGIYFADRARMEYAQTKAEQAGVVFRATLKRGAKIIDGMALEKEMARELEQLQTRAELELARLKVRSSSCTSDEQREQVHRSMDGIRRDLTRRELLIFTDPGRYAAHRGYDAIDNGLGTILVVNRTAIRVQTENL